MLDRSLAKVARLWKNKQIYPLGIRNANKPSWDCTYIRALFDL
jgi:hypothetical protein